MYTEFASSYDLHLHGEKNRARIDFLIYKPCIVLHCYFVCRKIDASSIIIRQLKTASACAFIFSGNVVVFQRATYASQCKLRRSFNISHNKSVHLTHKIHVTFLVVVDFVIRVILCYNCHLIILIVHFRSTGRNQW